MRKKESVRLVLRKSGYVTRRSWCSRLKCDTCKFKFKCYTVSKTITFQTSDVALYEKLTGATSFLIKDFVAGEWIKVKWDDKKEPDWYLVMANGTSYGCARCVNLKDACVYRIPCDSVIERFGKVEKPTI